MGQNCCTPGAEDASANDLSTGARPATAAREEGMTKNAAPAQPTATAAAAAAAAATAAPPSASVPAGESSGGLSFQMALADLDQAEQLAYGTAFAGFSPGPAGVDMQNQPLRDFVAANTIVAYEQVDSTLLQILQTKDEMMIDSADFFRIMRDNAIQEGEVIERFMSLAAEGSDSLKSEDCRSGLFALQDLLGPCADAVGDARWESVFDKVMEDAGATVSMEAWTNYCKKVARIARITQIAKL